MDQKPDDIRFSMLWPTVVMQATFPEHLEEMKQEVYKLAAVPSNIQKSNYGGWQSDVRLHENAVFHPLSTHVSGLCARVFKVKGAKFHQMWACINKKHDQ